MVLRPLKSLSPWKLWENQKLLTQQRIKQLRSLRPLGLRISLVRTTKIFFFDVFVVGGYKWRVLIFPKGNNMDHLSMYLDAADSSSLPYGWSRYAQFSLAVVNQVHNKFTIKKGDGSVSMYEWEAEYDVDASLFVVYNQMLHERTGGRRPDVEALKNKFLKNIRDPSRSP
ncbi:hypothetical protein L1987_37740 [Smallanthus sonchifolius]|uniref:Uncharacterized protein n=1 Tax=Smallanthus sonchifolius TaxID=185202 RepID=A0ACB9HJ13_9ASTR|nr:hypothetical protein L1987_37740 [Smallanthus sonchifolius]